MCLYPVSHELVMCVLVHLSQDPRKFRGFWIYGRTAGGWCQCTAFTVHCQQKHLLGKPAWWRPWVSKKYVKHDHLHLNHTGLPNLTNIRRGQCNYVSQWTIQKKRQYGVYLLNKAYNIYTIEGEQQIYPYNL